MFSHAWTNCFYKSKILKGYDEDSGGVKLTFRNPSKPQCLKKISALAKQSREPSLSSDCDELQEPIPKRTPMKLSVQPEKDTNNEYENEADHDFRPSSQQLSQSTH